MNNNLPLVSIIVACRNEERYISKCLDSLIGQDYPKEKIEIIIVDGMSEDGTREIVKKYTRKQPYIKLLDNQKKITPIAFNLGIKNSKGKIIALKSAHTTYQNNYISRCVEYLEKYGADNIGGVTKILPSKNTWLAKVIAFSLSSPFGGGDAYYKTSPPRKSIWVDTVFGGCYKREVFEKIGLFNENLAKSQDMEFNIRLRKAGGKILLVPDIVAYYYPKSTIREFWKHNFEDGVWVIYPLKFVKMPFKIRHYIPLVFVASLISTAFLSIFSLIFFWLFLFILGLYCLVNIYFSFKIAIREKNLKYLFATTIAFACRHFGYGFGSILGLMKLLK